MELQNKDFVPGLGGSCYKLGFSRWDGIVGGFPGLASGSRWVGGGGKWAGCRHDLH